LCKIALIPDDVSPTIPLIPDHEVLRVIGRGAYGEIWLARSLTGALRAVKMVYRSTFESERAFQREFQGMSSFEPISRAHAGFVDILHVGRTTEYLYYIMELADDHIAGRKIDIIHYEPRTLKSDLARHNRLSAKESIQLGLSLTEALDALHEHGLTHRDIKPSNIIFIDGVPKLADIGLVAAAGQRSFVGTEGYVPPEGPGTPQADLFSLGKLLYEVSTGKDRLDFPELDSQLSEREDKDQVLQLNGVLIKACANQPSRRYASARRMHDDLAALARGEPPKKPRAKFVLIALSVLVAGAAIFGLYESRQEPSRQERSRQELRDVRLQVSVKTEPAGALVLLGEWAKRSPATFEDLEPREYNMRVMLPGYDPMQKIVDVKKSVALPVVRLKRSKGALEIRSEPSGAGFSLRSDDGQFLRNGVTPATLVELPTGKYALTANRGDWDVREEVEVERGETTRRTFAFVNGTLSITSEPTGAEIFVDGSLAGETPTRMGIAARRHELSVRLGSWPEQHQSVVVEAHKERSAHFVFGNGSVKITSAPGGATVLASGRELGRTPFVIEDVKLGAVTYELRLAGYKPTSVTGEVTPRQQTFLAARLEKDSPPQPGEAWTNSLGMKFVLLGQIRISIWETRVQDYEMFCRATGRRYEPPDFQQRPTDPVVKVNWFDATAFCKWLTENERAENVLEDRQFYRLPTDREWSAAVGLPNESGGTPEARDGKISNEFPWGKQWPAPPDAGNYGSFQLGRTTMPVGSFKPNALGIYDLGGNVWEWCLESYKGNSGTASRDWGVLRGGSWATSNRVEMQSSYRNVVDRNERDVICGFRCVLATESHE
jgi:formylglycine-generating enzyme required for sulfatase activity/serine/threonine protein kinase